MSVKLTYEKVKNYIEIESGSGCKLLSKEYKNSTTKMLLECACGDEFETAYATFKSGKQRQCPKCGREKSNNKKRLDYEYVKHFIEVDSNSGCKLLSEKYKNNATKLLLQCKCGNELKTSFVTFRDNNKRQCNECTKEIHKPWNAFELQYIKDYISCFNCELLSDTYQNNLSIIQIKCLICGDVFDDTYSNFSRRENKCHHCSLNESNSTVSKYMRKQIKDWVKDSFEFYNYKCILTGESRQLEVHHLYSFNSLLEETMDKLNLPKYNTLLEYTPDELSNIESLLLKKHYEKPFGVPLTKNIHSLFHTVYGNKNSSLEQFAEFKERFLNNEFTDAIKAIESNQPIAPSKAKKNKHLSKEDVREIRGYIEKGFPNYYIAKTFNCSDTSVSDIKTNKSWKKVI